MSSSNRGYYSLVQYCPDRSRMESANVGVVLFCPELDFLQIKFAIGNDRLRRFFGSPNFDAQSIKSAKLAITNRFRADGASFRTIEDLEHFINTRANALVMTAARPIRVDNAREQLHKLFRELVVDAEHDRPARQAKKALDAVFKRPDLQSRLKFDQVVKVPIIGRELKAPYAYQNGALNLIKPQDFPANEASASDTAMRLAMEGNLLWKHSQQEVRTKLIVVSSFVHDSDAKLAQRITGLFEKYEVETIPVSRVDELATRVEREGH